MTVVLVVLAQAAAPSGAPAAAPGPAELKQVVADYVGLYTKETLPRWRELFLPTFTAAHTRPDGTVKVRALDEFYGAQERYFATGRAIREDLENVEVERRGKLAAVSADFVLTEEGERSRGTLVLVLMVADGRWRIQSLAFSYDGDRDARAR